MSGPPDEEELHFESDGGCFGCSAHNPHGLHMRFWRRGDAVVSRLRVDDRYHGAPGIAHGGIVATMMDEVSCAAAVFLRGSRVVTGELSVRYQLPCPVEVPLEIESRVSGEHPRYLIIEAVLRAHAAGLSGAHAAGLARDGTVLARSSGKFFYVREPAAG